MTFSPVVAFTVNDRPEYLKETLESWSVVRGVENAHLIFACEPGCPEAVQMCQGALFAASTAVGCSPERQGVLANPWKALEIAFRACGADFAVLAEEDLVVSPDVLEYFEWCQRYRDDPGVLGITTYQCTARPGGLAGVGEADWSRDDQWHFWCWGLWADRWQVHVRDNWDFTYDASCGCPPNMRGWDWALRNHMIRDGGMRMISPSMSRSQHIGEHGGVHCRPEDFRRLLSPSFAGLEVPPQAYFDRDAMPSRAPASHSQPSLAQAQASIVAGGPRA